MTKNLRRCVKIPTANLLAQVALRYLSRFAASEKSLRSVLENRLRRAALQNPAYKEDLLLQETLHNAIETIIGQYKKTGAINDLAYSETKLHSLRRQGRSRRAIERSLMIKGVKKAIIDKVINQDNKEGDGEDKELEAAIRLAQRRKIGPYRRADRIYFSSRKNKKPSDVLMKDFAILSRAGFSLDVVRKVLASKLPDEGPF